MPGLADLLELVQSGNIDTVRFLSSVLNTLAADPIGTETAETYKLQDQKGSFIWGLQWHAMNGLIQPFTALNDMYLMAPIFELNRRNLLNTDPLLTPTSPLNPLMFGSFENRRSWILSAAPNGVGQAGGWIPVLVPGGIGSTVRIGTRVLAGGPLSTSWAWSLTVLYSYLRDVP